MKKRLSMILAILLATVMALTLAACTDTPSPSASPSPAQDTGGGTSSSDALFGPDDTITLAYLSYSMDIGWCVQVADAFEDLASAHNLNVHIFDGGFSPETQFNQIEQAIAMGVDVIALMSVDPGSAQAIADRIHEADILLLGETAAMRDVNGQLVVPCNWLHGLSVGRLMTQWVVDNHARFGFDLTDFTNVGFMYITDTMFPEMADRVTGTEEVWFNNYPDFPRSQLFVGDRSAELESSNMEAGYNQTASILTANPQIETWFIISFQEDYASGACRAVEDLGLVDRTFLVSAGGENVIPEWDAGLTKPWYAANYFTGMDSAEIIVGAIEKVLRQGVAIEDVYADMESGGKFPYATFSGVMVSFEDYKGIIR